jgi:hypothetical protein
VYESSWFIALAYVLRTPCWATVSTSLRTWSGRERALPRSDMFASVTFMTSVPVEMSEYRERTSTPPGRQAGAGTSRTESSPVL